MARALLLAMLATSAAGWTIGTSGHAYYNFPYGTPHFDTLEYDVRWLAMPSGHNCYAAMMIYWEGGTGYMGSQFHSDGKQVIDFAIWDANSNIKNTKPLGPCTRFGGEGDGAHCITVENIEVGRTYRFKAQKSYENATGVAWSVLFIDLESGDVHDGGSLFWDESMSGTKLGKIRPTSVSFQEYYTGGDFASSMGFVGPTGTVCDQQYLPSSAMCVCDAHHSCSADIPGIGSGKPNVLLFADVDVPTPNNWSPIW